MLLYALAIPMNGSSISRSVTPSDRRSERFGARWYPDFISSLRISAHQYSVEIFTLQQFYAFSLKSTGNFLLVRKTDCGIDELFYHCVGKIRVRIRTKRIMGDKSVSPVINSFSPCQAECKLCIMLRKHTGVMKFMALYALQCRDKCHVPGAFSLYIPQRLDSCCHL